MRTRCQSRCTTARSMSASAARWKGDENGFASRRVATSTLSRHHWGDVDLVVHVVRRRERAGSPSGSAAPTTGWTSRAARSSCPPTVLRCWNVAPRSEANYLGAQGHAAALEGALDVLAQHVMGMLRRALRCR